MLYFWQETILLILALFSGVYLLIDKLYYRKPFYIGWSDVLIFAWLLLIFLYSCRNPSVRVQVFSLFFVAWCISKCSNARWIWLLWVGLYVVCIYSAVVQLSKPNFTRLYGFSGNPGVYANILLPFFCQLLCGILYIKIKYRRYVAVFFVIPIIVLLILTQSRAVWVGAFAAIVFLALYSQRISLLFKKRTSLQLLGLTVVAMLVFGLVFKGLYVMRPAPVDGRMLIYKVSTEAVLEKPQGRGLGSFKTDYTQLQGEYLKRYPDSKFAILADDTKNAFLDILQVGFEMGWLAVLFFIVSLFFLLRIPLSQKYKVEMLGLKATLFGLVVASFFSYPLYQWLPSMQISVMVGMLISYDRRYLTKIHINLFGRIIFVLLIVMSTTYVINRQCKRYMTHLLWNEVRKMKSIKQNKEFLVASYVRLMDKLPHNGLLKYHYGVTLFELGEYEKSVLVLKEAAAYFNELNLWMCLAESYRALGKFDESIVYFLKAYHMIPKRFMPLYKLMLVSKEAENIEQAKRYAMQILHKAPKIPSSTVDAIKLEAQIFLLEN